MPATWRVTTMRLPNSGRVSNHAISSRSGHGADHADHRRGEAFALNRGGERGERGAHRALLGVRTPLIAAAGVEDMPPPMRGDDVR